MSATHETRVWLGWRKPAAEGGPADWAAFRDALGQRFLPATWRVMTQYGLLAYGPSVLSDADDAEGLPWPDETAVLVYRSVADYKDHRNHDDGKQYSAMHGEVFTRAGGPRGSRADWALTAPPDPDKPLRRLPKPGGADFSQPAAILSVLFLSTTAALTAEKLMARLPAADSEAVVWCTQGMAIVWLASMQPLTLKDVLTPIQEAWPEAASHQWLVAQPVPTLKAQGVDVHDNTGWCMCAGLTEIEA